MKSLIRKQPQELLLVIGTGVSAAVAPGIPALCSWRSCIEAVIEAAEQLEVLHPGDVAEFRRKVTKDRDLLVVAHDLIRKMSPVSLSRTGTSASPGVSWFWARPATLRLMFSLLSSQADEPGIPKSIGMPSL